MTTTTRESVDLAHARARARLGVAEGWREMEGAMPLECNPDALRRELYQGMLRRAGEHGETTVSRGDEETRDAVRDSRIERFDRTRDEDRERARRRRREVLMTSARRAGTGTGTETVEEETLGLARARVEFIRERVAGAPGSIARVVDGPEIDVRCPVVAERFLDEDEAS